MTETGNRTGKVSGTQGSVGYELAIIISYPTRASGIIVFIKNAHKISSILPDFICKTTDFQLIFNFEQALTVAIFGEHGIPAHIP